MNQRRRLTTQEREAAAVEAEAQKPGKVFVQEWTDPDGRPVIVKIIEQ